MHRKTRKKKKSPIQKILSPSDESIVASLLKDFEEKDPFQLIAGISSPNIAEAIIERLPLSGDSAVVVLKSFQNEFSEKSVQKAVKRAFFKLETKGISVEPDMVSNGPDPDSILKPVKDAESQVFIGPIADSWGLRAVVIILTRSVKGQYLAVGMASDEKGIQEFLFGNFSRKKVREIKNQISDNAGPLVKTTLSHAAAILEIGYQSCREDGKNSISPDFIEFRPVLLDLVPEPDKRVLDDFIPQLSGSEKTITQAGLQELFEKVTMKNWIITFDILRPYMEEIFSVDDSPLFLTDAQKLDRIREPKLKAMSEIFPPPRRHLLKDRLIEMSYFFSKLGDDRSSRLALSASECMAEEGGILGQNPVLEFLVEQSFSFYNDAIKSGELKEESKDEDPSGLIVT
ncbi:hypothetical protein ACFL2O_05135 [Thermodesulfobacteriota bacterium]